MSHTPDRDPRSESDATQRFTARVAEHYRPEPLSLARRARFDAALRERIERPRARAFAFPSVVGAAAALGLAWLVWPAAAPPPAIAPEPSAFAARWESDVLEVGTAPFDEVHHDEEEYLPDEYSVIAAAFLDEV